MLKHDTLYRLAWAAIAMAILASLVACHLTPAAAGVWAASGTAAVDAATGKMVEGGILDPQTASMFSGWAHLLSDTMANITGLTAKLQAAQEATAQHLATVQAQIPTTADRAIDVIGGATTGFAATRAHRGSPTPAIVKRAIAA